MSGETEEARLEREINERGARLDELRAPMTRDEAQRLAREKPDEFNRRYEACKAAGVAYITSDKEEDR